VDKFWTDDSSIYAERRYRSYYRTKYVDKMFDGKWTYDVGHDVESEGGR
jgi:hypothetical protein